jgi:hypothetical protein
VNYVKLLEINSFFTWYIFLEVGKTQDILSKIWQTAGDALTRELRWLGYGWPGRRRAGSLDGDKRHAGRP